MDCKYQIIFLGNKHPLIGDIKSVLNHHFSELGLGSENISYVESSNFRKVYRANAPTFCLFFGGKDAGRTELSILRSLIKSGTLILPIVADLNNFSKQVPKELVMINGFQLESKIHIERLASTVLEGLSLLRLSRRLFVSYKRTESGPIALQLFEQLEKAGFDVFLDTHSVKPGDDFQAELWHRLADSDVVVLLNTPGFLQSEWTQEEVAKANSMSIGILQIIWPNHTQEKFSKLSSPFILKDSDFDNATYKEDKKYLCTSTVNQIVSRVESLRARSLSARQCNLSTEFIKAARSQNVSVHLQPQKFITIIRDDGKSLIVIPTVGVPQAFTYHQSEKLVERAKSKDVAGIYLLYDHLRIRENWLEHLDWLNAYLHVKTMKVVGVKKIIAELINAKKIK